MQTLFDEFGQAVKSFVAATKTVHAELSRASQLNISEDIQASIRSSRISGPLAKLIETMCSLREYAIMLSLQPHCTDCAKKQVLVWSRRALKKSSASLKSRLRQIKCTRKEAPKRHDVSLERMCKDEWDDAVSNVHVHECSSPPPYTPLTVDQMLSAAQFLRAEGILTLSELCEFLRVDGAVVASAVLRVVSRAFPVLVVRGTSWVFYVLLSYEMQIRDIVNRLSVCSRSIVT